MTRLDRPKPPTSRDLVHAALSDPGLALAVRALTPRALGAVVRHLGLEDAGEIVALASAEQLVHLLDEDVWKSVGTGADETLDADRFATWLEVLLEAGDEALADKLVDLPEDLLTHALALQVLVLDMDALGREIAELDESDADEVEKALDSGLYQELEGYRIVSKQHDGWDAVIAVLLALDKNHHDFLVRLLDRLVAASETFVEEHGGLVEALSEAERVEEDAAADREERRAREGYVSPASARAFLALAKTREAQAWLEPGPPDAVTRAYFRELAPTPQAPLEATDLGALGDLVRRAEADERGERRRPKLGRTAGPRTLLAAMAELAERAPDVHARRTEELAYLVNVVVTAGWEGRPVRPWEATEIVMGVVERALARATKERKATLRELSMDRLFLAGVAMAPAPR
ncbi:MAG TPA: DUF6178 family protein [Polyangiaceae bacterium]|nr:DUF6178 family protein [Polyangiaceae bacterium]